MEPSDDDDRETYQMYKSKRMQEKGEDGIVDNLHNKILDNWKSKK
jgi:hypothetical protein